MSCLLIDVNVLVYAFKVEQPQHDLYRTWLHDLIADGTQLAIAESVVTGFIRIVTSRRIYTNPAPTALANDFVEALAGTPGTSWLAPNDATWSRFVELCAADSQIRGNLVPDAWLAALALSNHCELATADRGFARYPGLVVVTPE